MPQLHTGGGVEPDDVREARAVMERHYGEVVRPISHYCRAFEQWWDALADTDDEQLRKMRDSVAFSLPLAIRKSNLLYRLIYAGLPLRTKKCSTHDGHWSGYGWGKECDCQVGPNITGWLP